MIRRLTSCCGSAVVILGLVTVANSQPAGPASALPGAGASQSTAPSSAAMDAEREKIWNSPTMLRARAWVQEYCQRSAKITPAEAQAYMTELSQLTPVQMKLWLLKFDHEEEMIRQQQSAFNASRQGGVNAAMGMQRATATAYADINRDETQAAKSEEGSLAVQQQDATERGLQNAADRDATNESLDTQPLFMGGYGPYAGFGPYGGSGPLAGAGDYHLHYHVHY